MSNAEILIKWASLSAEKRRAIILSDKSMRNVRWASLVNSMVNAQALTLLQTEALCAAPYRQLIEKA